MVPWAADVAMAYGLFLDAVVDEGRLFHLDEGPLNGPWGCAARDPWRAARRGTTPIRRRVRCWR
ncbi:hypothetical protein V2I01_04910 [Micromonospora sp. BRA006-A]|nr:hypothetical protein [Micromonospora sp. BRA006-A]